MTKQILNRLQSLGDPEIAAQSHRFFKTGPGEYGEGDIFLGIRVPVLRACLRDYRWIPLSEALELLQSPYHEARMLALLILVAQYGSSRKEADRRHIYEAYLQHARFINNWDLVDCSAQYIVGTHLLSRDRKPLYTLARSRDLWERRIAVLATFAFIRQGEFADTLSLAEILLHDSEDLIHKAIGWMLREVGKRDQAVLEGFLSRYSLHMPRTMLRYAIEKLPEDKRKAYLRGKISFA
ncbi:MAG: DNA alkylation repair protein [Desulfohalobiaceae bacterium]|nr:DNA alkylation repair protein [Desulfohalobiaceae bacterium]